MNEEFNKNGFTLLEIMIALAITGGLLVTLLYSLNYNLGIIERHEVITTASLLAQEKISEIRKAPGEKKGQFPEPFAAYSFDTSVTETSYPGISEIAVTVQKEREIIRFTEFVQR